MRIATRRSTPPSMSIPGGASARVDRALRTARTAAALAGQPDARADPRDGQDPPAPAGGPRRRVPGHWEGDLITGAGNRSAVATLVERKTRYELIAPCPDEPVRGHRRARECPSALPAHLSSPSPWTTAPNWSPARALPTPTGIQVYFSHPHSPWERGTNENTNGLLRQYFPRSTDLAEYTQTELDQIAAELNGRPRKTLYWNTAS